MSSNTNADYMKTQPHNRVQLTIIAAILSMTILYVARSLFIPIFIAIFFALLLNPIVCCLKKLKMPKALSAFTVVISFIAIVSVFFNFLFQPAHEWIEKVPQVTQEISKQIDEAAEPFTKRQEKAWYMLKRDEKIPVSEKIMEKMSTFTMESLANITPVFAFQTLTVIVLVLFFLIHGSAFYRNISKVLPSYALKKNLVEIGRVIQFQVSRYVFFITIINFSLGAATAVAMAMLGVEDPILWGAIAMLFNYVPYIGPLIVTILLSFVGFTQFDGAFASLKIPIVFTILNNIECQFITPMVLGRNFKVNPLIVILWLLVVGWMWGVVGVIMAVPMLVSIKILLSRIDSLKPWEKLLD